MTIRIPRRKSRKRQVFPGKVGAPGARNGTVTVEFALVAPVLFVLFLGSIEITRLNFIRHTASNAAYEGVRKAIVPGGKAADAVAAATNLLNAVRCGNGATVNIAETATQITATVRIPVNQNSWGIGRFSGGMTIQQSCTMARESPQG